MRLDNITAVHLPSTNTTIIWPLRSWKAILGPAVWPTLGTKQRIFLLQTEPKMVLLISIHEAGGFVTVVELVGRSIRIPGFAHDEDVGRAAEGVGVDGDGADVHVRVVPGSLAGGGAVEVPFWEVIGAFDFFGQGLR